MTIFRDILFIAISCLLLAKGATWLVDSAARIARRMGLSDLVIGLTVVAFGTSAPEFAVTILGAIKGTGDISVGNVIGSNIFNIGFIMGFCALFGAIKTTPSLVWRDGVILLAITLLTLVMLYDLCFTRLEGVILFSLLWAYLALLFSKKEADLDDLPGEPATLKDGVLFVVGLALIVGGGQLLVEGATSLAKTMGMAEWVIALTVVAAGTSVPELVVSLVALIKKHHGISAGNLIGSNIFNTLGVLGLAGIIRDLNIDTAGRLSVLLLVPLTVIVVLFMRTGWKVSRLEGAILLLISLAIWGYNFTMVQPA